ncbi:MAG: MaoC family dehydratase [Desulfobacterales bacterium]|nr:MaoC family dehydratase [Desulfobacterales bacterium]
MAKRTIEDLEELKTMVGQEIGVSDWIKVTQERVNTFAEATGDHQWIHVDPERAKKESPYGGPIAHGYLTMSLAPYFLQQIMEIKKKRMGVNYGLNKVRFPAPVPVGGKLRMKAEVAEIEEIKGGIQIVIKMTFEVEGQEKPCCIAEAIYRYYS